MARIEFALGRGERLLWSGEPRRGVMLQASDAFMIPFSLLWGGFALFWNVGVWASGAPLFFRLWGLPFLAVGAYITVGRFFFDARRRANTAYGLTTERILIASSGGFNPSIKSLALRSLSDVTLTERPDRSGTITFGPSWPGMRLASRGVWPGAGVPSFEGIPDAKRVYNMIRDAQADAGRATA